MLMFSERTWKHHAVTLLFPAAVLAHAANLNLPDRLRRSILGILTVAWLLIAAPGLFPEHLGDLALVYGTHTFAFLLLTMGTCLLLARSGRLEALRNEKDNLYGLNGRNGMDKPVGLANPQ
jgi:alpha-1,2-mannosyltransferase